MTDWKAKRFWKEATVETADGGFTVHLDARPVRTPLKSALIVPTVRLAQEIAAEWDAQEGIIDPLSMPHTRSANSAIDKVAPQHDAVAQMLADYGDSDLLCYRAPAPTELIARQAEHWDPLLDWAETRLGARLHTATGVIHVPQDPKTLARLSGRVHGLDAFALTGFHDLVSLSGSLILGFAAMLDHRPVDEIWKLSRVDEDWQSEQWGVDDEAVAMAETKRSAFVHAKTFHDLSRP